MKSPDSSPDPIAVGRESSETAHLVAEPSVPGGRLRRRRLLAGLPFAIGAVLLGKRSELAYAGSDGDWTLSGNAPANATSFLGTRNARALTLKTHNRKRMVITSQGKVGIGTAAPAARCHVRAGKAGGTAVYAVESAATGATFGVKAQVSSPTGIGISGLAPNSISTALSAIGVKGQATVGVQGTGEYMGVQGSSLNYAVFGYTTPDTGGIGVYGRGAIGVKGRSYTGMAVLGDTDSGVGVKGEAYSDGGGVKAVYGQCFGLNGNGVVGESSNGTAAYGVWGLSTNGYAGVFSGNALVTGTLSKGAGSFKIDHPLDPANKYLYHSFVESPDMMNVYNGNVTTDGKGDAVVTLPDYFDALNQDFRYQLTVLGQFAQAIVGHKIEGNRFAIKTDKPNVEVSWQVTGIRQDAFANANRIPVEELKPADERGRYLHPKENGKPERLSVQHARIQAERSRRSDRRMDPVVPSA